MQEGTPRRDVTTGQPHPSSAERKQGEIDGKFIKMNRRDHILKRMNIERKAIRISVLECSPPKMQLRICFTFSKMTQNFKRCQIFSFLS